MRKMKSKKFEFHFIIDVEMREKLMGLELYKEMGNFSQLIVKILSLLNPQIEEEHLSVKQRMSLYKPVNADMEIERKSVHVYLPDYLYRL